ncbi:MAG: carotenoid oxygenase family protein [Acidimicrobiales bacterium]|jgi:carotenoid cleavage oxygenase
MLLNRYLSGAFAPVDTEVTEFDLLVEGELPKALDGLYLRNGPNPIGVDPANYHWFTGEGMLHGIDLSGGKARSYRNRWVRTDQTATKLGEAPIAGQVPDTLLGQMTGSVANTNIVAHAGKLLALVEVNLPTEVDCNLDTVGRYGFGGRLSSSMTAHPHTDPVTGEMCFFGYEVLEAPYLRYHVADASGALVHSADITIPKPTMIHDFAITATRAIFMDLPVVYDLDLLGTRPFPAAWAPDNGARVGVMPRRGTDSDVIWCDVEPCYVFHVLNAFDSGDDVILDVCRYQTMFDEDIYGVGGGPARLERWTINPSSRKVITDVVADLAVEFPRPDERRFSREHRFGWFAAPRMADGSIGSADAMALAKVDLLTGAVEVHDFGSGAIAGEGVFVPASPEAEEGDGYLISIVADAAAKRPSDLVVLDATDLTAPPLATVHLPARVPIGFHGNFVPRSALPLAP